MRNVSPARALARQARLFLQIAFVAVTGGALLAVIGLLLFVIPFSTSTAHNVLRALLFFGGGGIALIGLALVAYAVTRRTDNRLALMTGNYLAQHLDERHTLVRNVSRRGLGYIDAVLVGPPGLLVFRIMDKEGIYTNEAGRWLKQSGPGKHSTMRMNPTQDTVVDVRSLRAFLRRRGMEDIPVYGVVVFARPEDDVKLILKDPVVPVAHLDQLMAALRDNYLAQERIPAATVTALVKLLMNED